MSLYMKCSWPVVDCSLSSPAATRSRLTLTATGPRFSSTPNQFWCSNSTKQNKRSLNFL